MNSPLKDPHHASWGHTLEGVGEAMRAALAASLRPFSLLAQRLAEDLAQRLAEDLAPLLSSFQFQIKRTIDAILPPPGTFYGDVLILFVNLQDGEREAALDRLAPGFSRRAVFYPARWRLLENKYRDFGEGEWPHLVKSALLLACDTLPDELPLKDLPRWLHKEVRKEIERALLDGYTLDECMPRATTTLPDTLERRLKVEEEIMQSEDTLTLQESLARLTGDDLRLFKLIVSGYSLKDAARRLGVSHAAVRQRWRRLLEKIKRF